MTTYLILVGAALFILLAYKKQGYLALVVATICGLFAWKYAGGANPEMLRIASYVALGVLALFGIPVVRRVVVSKMIMKMVGRTMPKIGETERIALEAGTVWWDGELFGGAPNWNKLLDFKIKKLTKEEQAFIDGPVEDLCKMLDDDKIAQDRDLPPKVWKFIKDKKFFGIEIPKKQGGLGFSSAAHAAVVTKVSSRSLAAAVIIMVPNSLGPAELLQHYGTPAQKKYYLPRLAKGQDIPCFALTEPHAGSDAANGRSLGVVCEGMHKGKKVLGIKATFDKRYITLAPVATVVGLALNVIDPDHLLGKKENLGITCALLPRDIKGMKIGNQHDPMGVPFPNGPIRGKDVFIPMEYVIGGKKYVGQGWRMLMESLSTGRGISLPSLSVGAAEFATRSTTAYATVREQFGMPIGKFEGVRERLARVAGHAYFMKASGNFTVGAVDAGESPSVPSAIAKAYLTEGMRLCINDGMDIFAGAAICSGPRNIMSRPYTSIPIGITVEGANILTRSLIVFGQGAIRCHPFVQKQVDAIAKKDLVSFDKAFFGHINHFVCTAVRSFILSLTGGRLACVPCGAKHVHAYHHLSRLSSGFALAADLGLATLGGALKRKEHLSGHYADAFGHMYMASATLKRAHDEGYHKDDKALVEWSLDHCLYHAEQGLMEVLRNMPNRFAGRFVQFLVFPFGLRHKKPSEKRIEAVANAILNPESKARDHLTTNVYVPKDNKEGMGMLEATYDKVVAAMAARKKLTLAVRKQFVQKGSMEDMVTDARKDNILTVTEARLIMEADKARDDLVQVNDFTPKEYKNRR